MTEIVIFPVNYSDSDIFVLEKNTFLSSDVSLFLDFNINSLWAPKKFHRAIPRTISELDETST